VDALEVAGRQAEVDTDQASNPSVGLLLGFYVTGMLHVYELPH
jgi:hypothetical protein